MGGRGQPRTWETEREVRSKRKREQDEWAKEGGYMQAKIQKLINKYEEDSGHSAESEETKSKIFQSVAIFINGYTEPSFDVLRKMMIEHGGTFEHYYSSTRVTHIIATSLALSKQKLFKNKKVVLPSWITDSVERDELQPYDKYLLLDQNRITNFFSSVTSPESAGPEGLDMLPELPDTELPTDGQMFDNITNPQPSTSGLQNKPTNPLTRQTTNADRPGASAHKSSSIVSPPSMLPADNPGFMSEFYGNSRLHHISHWRTHLKDVVNEIRSDPQHKLTGRDSLVKIYKSAKTDQSQLTSQTSQSDRPPHKQASQSDESSTQHSQSEKLYMHIDMDCFFVSVALRHKPELADKPVAVAHSKTESVTTNSMSQIASCNYAARQAGVRNGMFMGPALKLCPHLQTVPYDFDGYSEVSTLLYQIVSSYTTNIEAVSCDELYVDTTSLLNVTNQSNIASELRKEIRAKTGCPSSIGMGGNLLLARMATRKAKPDGQYYISSDKVEEFISTQSVSDLPGVGRATSKRLDQLQVKTCADLQKLSQSTLRHEFGAKTGESLYNLCRGVDSRDLRPDQPRQSVSCDVNYGIRLTDQSQVENLFTNVCKEVSRKLNNAKLVGRQVTLKIKVRSADAPVQSAKFMGHGICDNIAKSSGLRQASSDSRLIHSVCYQQLWRSLNIKPADLRGVGIQITKLQPDSAQSNKQSTIAAFLKSSTSNQIPARSDVTSYGTTSLPQKAQNVIVIDGQEDSSSQVSLVPNSVPVIPSMCGFSSLSDLTHLIKRWIQSYPNNPTNKDKLWFSAYMKSLVTEHHLDLLINVTNHFCKLLRSNKSEKWIQYYEDVIESLQKLIHTEYQASVEFPHFT